MQEPPPKPMAIAPDPGTSHHSHALSACTNTELSPQMGCMQPCSMSVKSRGLAVDLGPQAQVWYLPVLLPAQSCCYREAARPCCRRVLCLRASLAPPLRSKCPQPQDRHPVLAPEG